MLEYGSRCRGRCPAAAAAASLRASLPVPVTWTPSPPRPATAQRLRAGAPGRRRPGAQAGTVSTWQARRRRAAATERLRVSPLRCRSAQAASLSHRQAPGVHLEPCRPSISKAGPSISAYATFDIEGRKMIFDIGYNMTTQY
jgi:hypothetical protein